MLQQRIDNIAKKKPNVGMYRIPRANDFINPLIKKYGNQTNQELQREIKKLKNQLQRICYEFPLNPKKDDDYLRRFIITLKLLNNLLEGAFEFPSLSFDWRQILDKLIHLERNPDVMINSMLREFNRKVGYESYLMYLRDSPIKNTEIKKKQLRITNFF